MAAQRRGVQVLANPLRVEENRYQLDFNLIEEQLKTHRPTLWFFCSPHNPSGRIWREEEIRRCPISVNATARFWWSMRFTLNTFWMANSPVVSPLAVPPRQPDRAHIAQQSVQFGRAENLLLHDSRRLAAPALPPAAREELHYLAQFVRGMGNHSGLSTRSARLDALNGYLQGNARYLADASRPTSRRGR